MCTFTIPHWRASIRALPAPSFYASPGLFDRAFLAERKCGGLERVSGRAAGRSVAGPPKRTSSRAFTWAADWWPETRKLTPVSGRSSCRPASAGKEKSLLLPPDLPRPEGQRRRAGTGCVTQINETLWEGRYSPIGPAGKRRTRNIYAHSEAECERLLAEMIVQMKVELTAEKERLTATPIKAS